MSDRDSDASQFDATAFDTADFDGDDRLRAVLRGGDPAGSLPPADPAALKSLLEDIMSADLEIGPAQPGQTQPGQAQPGQARPRRTGATWLVAAAAVAAIAAGGAFAVAGLTGNDSNAPQADHQPSTTAPKGNTGIAGEVTQLKAGAAQDRCQVPTPELLAQYDQAFQGTVSSVDGNTITFQTTAVYNGAVGATVQLDAPPAGLAKMLTGVSTYQVGQSYVVAAYQGAVSMCGYSGLSSSPLQRVYKEAFVH